MTTKDSDFDWWLQNMSSPENVFPSLYGLNPQTYRQQFRALDVEAELKNDQHIKMTYIVTIGTLRAIMDSRCDQTLVCEKYRAWHYTGWSVDQLAMKELVQQQMWDQLNLWMSM